MSGGMHVRFGLSSEDFLAHLTGAAYRIALEYRSKGSFLDIELKLWNELREVLRQDMSFSQQCGSALPGLCIRAEQHEPFSSASVLYESDSEENS